MWVFNVLMLAHRFSARYVHDWLICIIFTAETVSSHALGDFPDFCRQVILGFYKCFGLSYGYRRITAVLLAKCYILLRNFERQCTHLMADVVALWQFEKQCRMFTTVALKLLFRKG